MSRYILPDLPYAFDALEPAISSEILELHYDKHHRAYVDAANQALDQLDAARAAGDFASLGAIEKKLAFNVSGHYLHSQYFASLSPDGGGRPDGALAQQIARDFGGFDTLKKQMNAAAAQTMGSGWAALIWEPLSARLLTETVHDHQSNGIVSAHFVLVLDAWEHAYYLQYRSDKSSYFDAIWDVWDWEAIAGRYARARAARPTRPSSDATAHP